MRIDKYGCVVLSMAERRGVIIFRLWKQMEWNDVPVSKRTEFRAYGYIQEAKKYKLAGWESVVDWYENVSDNQRQLFKKEWIEKTNYEIGIIQMENLK